MEPKSNSWTQTRIQTAANHKLKIMAAELGVSMTDLLTCLVEQAWAARADNRAQVAGSVAGDGDVRP